MYYHARFDRFQSDAVRQTTAGIKIKFPLPWRPILYAVRTGNLTDLPLAQIGLSRKFGPDRSCA